MTVGDKRFIREVLMPFAGISAIKIASSNSRAKWPDIWIDMDGIPTITVTNEWRRQNIHERRKRLVHEGCHILGLEHGRIGRYNFNTKPSLDTYSKHVYRQLIRR